MDTQERELLESLKNSLKNEFHNGCIDAYLKEPSVTSITKEALKELKGSINEPD
jgi:hypothetical protein